MTVRELIQKLQSLPASATVVAEGYEDGFDAIKKVSLIRVKDNPKKEWWLGAYVKCDGPDAREVVFLNAESKLENK